MMYPLTSIHKWTSVTRLKYFVAQVVIYSTACGSNIFPINRRYTMDQQTLRTSPRHDVSADFVFHRVYAGTGGRSRA
jgi:hypothetical protein